VEVAAAGSEDRLAELRKLLNRGPDGAEVSEVLDLEPFSEELDYPFAMKK
jgi:acylphosphatase